MVWTSGLVRSPRYRGLILAVLAFVALLGSQGVSGLSDFCIPVPDPVTGPPDFSDGLITGDKDGDLDDDSDVGWVEAAGFNLGYNTGAPNSVRLLLSHDSSYVYIGLDVIALGTLGPDDLIVLGLSSNPTSPAGDVLLHIQPFGPGGAPNANVVGPAYAIAAYTNSSGWTPQALTPPSMGNASSGSWPYQHGRAWKSADNSHWSFELRVPRASSGATFASGVHFPAGAAPSFKIYVNVVRSNIGLVANEAPWPVGTELLDPDMDEIVVANDTTAVPLVSSWADGSLAPRPACTGVYLPNETSIGTTNSPSSAIRLYRPPTGGGGTRALTAADCPPSAANANNTNTPALNTFQAKPENNTGSPATGVRVRYKIANWGFPPDDLQLWEDIPGPNPGNWTNTDTVPVSGVMPRPTFSLGWSPTFKQSCFYLSRPHHCMAAIMESTVVGTRFLNTSMRRNVDFVTSSTFQREATLDMRGHKALPGRPLDVLVAVQTSVARVQRVILDRGDLLGVDIPRDPTVSRRLRRPGRALPEPLPVPARARLVNARRGSAMLTWIARGYVRTGRYIVINKNKYEAVREFGGYGYNAVHRGPFAGWQADLGGGGLKPVANSPNLFVLTTKPDVVQTVSVRLQSIEGRIPTRFPQPKIGVFVPDRIVPPNP